MLKKVYKKEKIEIDYNPISEKYILDLSGESYFLDKGLMTRLKDKKNLDFVVYLSQERSGLLDKMKQKNIGISELKKSFYGALKKTNNL